MIAIGFMVLCFVLYMWYEWIIKCTADCCTAKHNSMHNFKFSKEKKIFDFSKIGVNY